MNSEPKHPNAGKRETAIKAWMWIFSVAAFILVVLGVIEWHWGHRAFFGGGNPSLSDWGNYGSYLQGTVASLWSLAAFFIIFVAFLAQKQQLSLQQRQFERQSFENHFFQLLALHNKIVDDIREPDCTTEGRPLFQILWKRLKSTYEEMVDGRLVSEDTEELAVVSYENLFDRHQTILAHYFRNLYQIIKFVDESGIWDKKRYISIVRAQLSTFEHILLHYNGLSDYGRKRFKPLIERYSLLEGMNPTLLVNSNERSSYSKEAFGNYPAMSPITEVGPSLGESPPIPSVS